MMLLLAIARRVGQRLLSSIPALLGVVIITFVLMRMMPGDPAVFFASGPGAGQAEIDELRPSPCNLCAIWKTSRPATLAIR
jgi:peptide/nickel transport system permease protein